MKYTSTWLYWRVLYVCRIGNMINIQPALDESYWMKYHFVLTFANLVLEVLEGSLLSLKVDFWNRNMCFYFQFYGAKAFPKLNTFWLQLSKFEVQGGYKWLESEQGKNEITKKKIHEKNWQTLKRLRKFLKKLHFWWKCP